MGNQQPAVFEGVEERAQPIGAGEQRFRDLPPHARAGRVPEVQKRIRHLGIIVERQSPDGGQLKVRGLPRLEELRRDSDKDVAQAAERATRRIAAANTSQ